MIQFNLLPDVKLEYIKARRAKRFVMLISTLVTGVALAILVLLAMVVLVLQKQHLGNLSRDIDRDSKAIKETKDIEKILTIQSQLTRLPDLHNQKPVASRLFDYVKQITPANVSMARLDVNYPESTISVTGAADSLATVNKFVDTLKFTEFKSGDPEVLKTMEFKRGEQELAFFDVVLTNFGRDVKGASYKIDFKFNPAIFESVQDDPGTDTDESRHSVVLIVPNIITTRSQIEKPEALFQPLSDPNQAQGQ